jgi:transcription initiation factor TFIIIB Brf1 subunit/transcription initiation factor TFIIB
MCPSGTNHKQAMDREPTLCLTTATEHRHHQYRPGSCAPSKTSEDDEDPSCRHCGSHSLRVDWAEGDQVCTHCGVVAQERIRDEKPEWRDYNEPDDIAKGAPAAARCGMIPVNESRYLGGLQPTSLSKTPFGATSSGTKAATMAMIRKRLQSTNRKLDHMMGQHHATALKNARISRLIRKRQLNDANNGALETDQSDLESVADDDVPPELEHVLIREEEDASRMQIALNADKWSLRRAILLHGNHESLDDPFAAASERDDLQSRLDTKLRRAAADLYLAYQMLGDASRRLQLPDRVTQEATTMLCRYAALRDGFHVKGVSSRLALKRNNLSAAEQKQAADTLREHNKWKQMGTLCAALLLLTARKMGWPRPLADVCAGVHAPKSNTRCSKSADSNSSCIKPKHCVRAMEELKSYFPDYARSISVPVLSPQGNGNHTGNHSMAPSDPDSTINFVDHAVRKLQLPPVAEASIRALVWHSYQEQCVTGHQSGTKLSTICASLAYFVCQSGSIMQQLASQAQRKEKEESRQTQQHNAKSRFRLVSTGKNKRTRNTDMAMPPPPPKKPRVVATIATDAPLDDKKDAISSVDDIFGGEEAKSTSDDCDPSFDVFSHAVESELLVQKREYEMRRVWDAWAEQTSWLRSVSEVEQSSGVSSTTILAHYKANIYPRRQALLEWLRDAVVVGRSTTTTAGGGPGDGPNVLTETPMATVLLSHVVAAAPLLFVPGRHN